MRNMTAVFKKGDALLECLDFMSRVFWGPDPETCTEWAENPGFTWVNPLVPLMESPFTEAFRELMAYVEKFPDGASLYEHLESAYVRLFVNTLEGISAPLNQSCYEAPDAPVMGPPAVAMKERLISAGLIMGENIHEPPDHLSIQLEYLYFLLDKALKMENRRALIEASTFAGDIMSPWVSIFSDKLSAETNCRFYPLCASALCAMLNFISVTLAGEKDPAELHES